MGTKQEDDAEGTFICDYLQKMPFSVIKSSVRYYSNSKCQAILLMLEIVLLDLLLQQQQQVCFLTRPYPHLWILPYRAWENAFLCLTCRPLYIGQCTLIVVLFFRAFFLYIHCKSVMTLHPVAVKYNVVIVSEQIQQVIYMCIWDVILQRVVNMKVAGPIYK